MHERNEVGTAPARARPRVPRPEAERTLAELTGDDVRLGDRVVVSSGPANCPACQSTRVDWAITSVGDRSRDEIHPVAWDEDEWLADTFVCLDCQAGWIEPDNPQPITWVRPFWRVGS